MVIDSFKGNYYSGSLRYNENDKYYYVNYRMVDYGFRTLEQAKEKYEECKAHSIRTDQLMKGEF